MTTATSLPAPATAAAETESGCIQAAMVRVGIVEDNRELRASLQRLVAGARGCSFVGAFATAEDALKALPALAPDVVLMDVHLPCRSGIECTRRLKDLSPKTQVLILTVYEDNDTILEALRAGASGYLLKRASQADILTAIREVHDGGAPMSSQIARKVVASFRQPGPAVGEEGLSERELEVLGLMSKGYSEKEVAYKIHVSLNTLKTHRKHIYQKLHVRSRAEILLKFQAKA